MSAIPEPVARILRYAGRDPHEVRNPRLTAREAVVLADYFCSMLTMSPEQIGQFIRQCEDAKADTAPFKQRRFPPRHPLCAPG